MRLFTVLHCKLKMHTETLSTNRALMKSLRSLKTFYQNTNRDTAKSYKYEGEEKIIRLDFQELKKRFLQICYIFYWHYMSSHEYFVCVLAKNTLIFFIFFAISFSLSLCFLPQQFFILHSYIMCFSLNSFETVFFLFFHSCCRHNDT